MPEIKKLVLDDPDTQSADIVGENIQALEALFPEAFKEGGIDFDVLKQLLGGAVNDKDEKYGLNWHGKRKARQIALTPSTGTLLPSPDESVDWDTTQNLMIEGDNLEVLKLLQKSYNRRIKAMGHGSADRLAVSTTGGHINTAEAFSLVIEQAKAGEALLINTFARVHLRQPLSLTGNCSVTMKVSACEEPSIRCRALTIRSRWS